jgi:hypothetical protein
MTTGTRGDSPTDDIQKDQLPGPELPDEAIEEIKRRRFQERVQRVMAVMQQERIDWRGIPFLTPDGRIGVRVVPVEMNQPPGG